MIEARQLTKVFRDKKRGQIRAVNEVSFRCEPGQIFGLLGVNGAGKTTCLRLLGTILQPSSGTASVAGFDLLREPARVRASIGFLSTATALYGRLTAQEMVEYFGRLHGLAEAVLHERIESLFSTLDMNEFRHRRCEDVLTARTVVHFIRDCRARAKTVIFSTHTMREAEKLCDTIAIIHQGRIMAEGTLAQLRAQTGAQDLEDVFVSVVEAK